MLKNADSILKSKCFYLSKLRKMNDEDERDLHKDELDRIFVLSFCHSNAKDIPLFYLYSGIDGKGCRIEFTQHKIVETMKGEVFPVIGENAFGGVFPREKYEVMAGWLHYISSDGAEKYRNNPV